MVFNVHTLSMYFGPFRPFQRLVHAATCSDRQKLVNFDIRKINKTFIDVVNKIRDQIDVNLRIKFGNMTLLIL